MTAAQQRAMKELYPMYGIEPSKLPRIIEYSRNRARPIHCEIGIGNGENLIAMARAHPEADFIGCEVHRPGVGYALQRIHAVGLENVRVYCGDVWTILHALPAAAMDFCYVFFPDPWPKKRHHKRRLVSADFFAAVSRVSRSHGRFYFASDSEDYADQVRELLDTVPAWRNLAGGNQWSPRPQWRITTRFEKRAREAGRSVRELAAAKIGC